MSYPQQRLGEVGGIQNKMDGGGGVQNKRGGGGGVLQNKIGRGGDRKWAGEGVLTPVNRKGPHNS